MPGSPTRRERRARKIYEALVDPSVEWTEELSQWLERLVGSRSNGVNKRIDESLSVVLHERKRELAAQRRELERRFKDIEELRDLLSEQHLQIAEQLDALRQFVFAKTAEGGEFDEKAAKVYLATIEKIFKATGVYAPPKMEVEVKSSGAFDWLDAIEAEVAEGDGSD